MRNLALIVLALFVLVGCGGSSSTVENTIDQAPQWAAQSPQSESHIYGSGSGLSSTYEMALEKAETRAQEDIGSAMQLRMRSMTEDFQEEVSGESMQQFTQATRTVVNQTLRGTQVSDTKIYEEDGKYRAFVLVKMPVGKAAQDFLSKIENTGEMYARFRKSEAFQRMENAIERYEQDQQSQ